MKNGKAYVGITCQSPSKRWNKGRGYYANKKFSRAIEEYGWDAFSHTIIADGLSKREACDLEKKMIANLNLVENGYNNCVCGGQGVESNLNKEARSIRDGFRRFSHTMPHFKEAAEMFDAAETAGVGSNLCDNINIHCEHIVRIMTENGDPPGYADCRWLSFFLYRLCESVIAIGEMEETAQDNLAKGSRYAKVEIRQVHQAVPTD